MAIRKTTHVLKNSDIIARPLPSSMTKGEPIVNLADGILLFSGITQSTSGWTQSGPIGLQPNYFEVGSNLYDLKIRNKITSYNGLTDISGKFLSGTTSGFVLANISDILTTDTFVTGGTYSSGTAVFTNSTGGTFNVTGFKTSDLVVTGGTYDAGTAIFTNNTGGTFSVSGFATGDTYTTGFTYTAAQNKLSILRNQGLPSLDVFVTSVSGLTVSDLTTNRIVYTTTDGKLITGNASFDGTNMILPSTGSLSVGTGGLVVGSGGSAGIAGTGDLVVNGNLTVFGGSVSAFTTQLYVEDPNVIFNYNPTGSTISTSIGAGLSIQDGNGITNGNVTFEIRNLNTFTGLTASQTPIITEYSGSTGFENRGWVTQLNDIILRSTDPTIPNGVRVLTEFDILDGGTF